VLTAAAGQPVEVTVIEAEPDEALVRSATARLISRSSTTQVRREP